VNWWALLFVVAALASIAWGLAAIRSHRQDGLIPSAALIAALVVGALVANLVRLSHFRSYWPRNACSMSGYCPVSTHTDTGQ
jgi:hypothetical protein